MPLKNDYYNIKYLNDRLKDNDLNFDERKEIIDDIDQRKKNIPKRKQKIYKLKKDLQKRIRTDQAKSFKDQNK